MILKTDVWTVVVAAWFVVMALVGSFAGAAEVVTEMPTIPADLPLVRDTIGGCASGAFYLHVYDTNSADPASPSWAVYGPVAREDGKTVHGVPFLILQGTNEAFVGWLRLPGRGIQKLTKEELQARFDNPCEIVDQINASPA